MQQLTYPCAGIGQDVSASNRTAWPVDGGSLKITATHKASDVYIALAFGDSIPKAWYFNHTLTPAPLNQTGAGSFCLPYVPVPSNYNVTDGTTASLQVIMYAFDGATVYGCSDIVFSDSAKLLSSVDCTNMTGVTIEHLVTDDGSESGSSTSGAPRGPLQVYIGVIVALTAVGFSILM
ncbi:hypothetical protein UCRPA7_4859 [Phaeoacremonium minimum UCRPA7]|uniref:Copper acquisition factor BIM1-like domain-containing protein n=1 Tax=Phaeoacremonium minimum (strain UCR-PA7) TaxID=1286976 RepID=R8BK19_PHAM7|nr:hypothetical protein UCRPA7_4859 [Phaeoacremonium minimum UCRPA7]EON99629.1 hypothetical protein UCRPA7_4859 [Phaeoacremonium minimum UCRPA7]